LVKRFVAGSTARTAAALVGVHRNTAALFFAKLRAVIAAHQEREMAEVFDGPVEIDESYFGGHRRGPRGRGAAGKAAVFGVLERGGQVYAQRIADCRRDTLLPIIRRKVKPASGVYSDTFASHDTLSVQGYEQVRINHAEELATAGGRHIKTGSRTSGARPSATWDGSTGCPRLLPAVPPRGRVALQRRNATGPAKTPTRVTPQEVNI
jgi:transposase